MFPISQEDRLNLPKSSKVSDEQFNNRVRESEVNYKDGDTHQSFQDTVILRVPLIVQEGLKDGDPIKPGIVIVRACPYSDQRLTLTRTQPSPPLTGHPYSGPDE